jgi:hypothetical protein
MNQIIIARMRLEDISGARGTNPRAPALIEVQRGRGIELLRNDIESSKLGSTDKVGIELRWLKTTEVPALCGAIAVDVVGGKQRAEILNLVGLFVIAD